MKIKDVDNAYKALVKKHDPAGLIAKCTSICTNIDHHRNMVFAFERGVGEIMQDVRAGNADPSEAKAIVKQAGDLFPKLAKEQMNLQSTESKASKAVKEFGDFSEPLDKFIKENPQDKDIKKFKKIQKDAKELHYGMRDTIVNGTERGFKASTVKARFDKTIAASLKKGKDVAKADATSAEKKDRIAVILNTRNIAVNTKNTKDTLDAGRKAAMATRQKIGAVKEILKNRPKDKIIVDVSAELSEIEDAKKGLDKLRSLYASEIATMGKQNPKGQKAFLATADGKKVAALLKVLHNGSDELEKVSSVLESDAKKIKAIEAKMAKKKEDKKKAAEGASD